jgi:aldehyde:ferredoxin oxidoreductase
MTTGLKEDKESLHKRAGEITNLVRCYNIQEGMKADDDKLPRRLHKEILKTGHTIKEEELGNMLQDYYNLRGWNKKGLPEATLLKDLFSI